MAGGRTCIAFVRGKPDPKRLVLESADAAEGVGAYPAELEMALLCERWNSLPDAGGVLDQKVGLLARMTTALNVFRAIRSEQNRGNMKFSDWSRQYPDTWRTLVRVEKLRREQ